MPLPELDAILSTLPPDLRAPQTREPLLQGQTTVQVYRLSYAWGTAILKGPLQPREAAFYRTTAPIFVDHGIAVPQVLGWGGDEAAPWLAREDLPGLLPHARLVADAEMLATLHRIHALPMAMPIADPHIAAWATAEIESLQEILPDSTLAQLTELHDRHAALFAPQCVVAGDPNSSNWGLRVDGTLVLFDWDRVGYGVPALDLAIIAPSLGWPTMYETIAASYLGDGSPAQIQQLAHNIAIAKVLTLVNYVNLFDENYEPRQIVLALLPSWIAMIARMDASYHGNG